MAAGHPVRVEYYATFRERRGAALDELHTAAATPRELYRELQAQHGFPWAAEGLRVAVNDEFCSWDAALAPHDRIVFIAPVAGG